MRTGCVSVADRPARKAACRLRCRSGPGVVDIPLSVQYKAIGEVRLFMRTPAVGRVEVPIDVIDSGRRAPWSKRHRQRNNPNLCGFSKLLINCVHSRVAVSEARSTASWTDDDLTNAF